jgi:tRNA U34 5-methylaminomethyl-2-thiouridine-forming methyltransferase MnmC
MNIVESKDGTYTAYSKQYDEHYHNISDGALNETLNKHVIPAFEYIKQLNINEINILDICFGLGYNSIATLYFYKKNNFNKKITIYSPELDKNLLDNLKNFTYPKEFKKYENIIKQLSDNHFYQDENITIKIFNQDAREMIKKCDIKFDIIYQDAFSSKKNHSLWTKEYFNELKNISKNSVILTTYSISTPVRMGLFENGFSIYNYILQNKKTSTLAFLKKQNNLQEVDMIKKIQNSPNATSLKD